MRPRAYDLGKIKTEKILGGPIKLVMTNDKHGSKNHLLAFGVFKPGEGLYPHLHQNSEEVYYVVKGKGTVFVGREKKPRGIRTNEIIYIPAKTPHGVTNTGKEELVVAFIMTPGLKPADYMIAKDIEVVEEGVLRSTDSS